MLARKMIVGMVVLVGAFVFLATGICSAARTKAIAERETKEKNKIVLEYDFSEPTFSKRAEYDLAQMSGLETHNRTGAPIVPVQPTKILVPFGKKVVDCKVTDLGMRQLPGTYRLAPAQQPYPLSHRGPVKPTEPDPAIYGQAKPWPGRHHEQVTTQSKRGYQILTVNLFPLQYVPTTGKISHAGKLRVEIELADTTPLGVLGPTEELKADLAATVDNPSALESYQTAGELAASAVGEVGVLEGSGSALASLEGGPYAYVVITSQALKDAPGPWNFQALCDTKIAKGITATIVTTEWIYANYDGTRPDGGSDNQTKIRNFLIDAYQPQHWGTQYVLLGGNINIVPARMFYVNSLAGPVDNMPVDMYYGCLYQPEGECTFDYDADGKYGEPTDGVGGGEVDLLAEIYVGRAAVENATEVANFVRKTLTYDFTPITESEYLSRIAMLGEYLGFGGVSNYATDSMEQIRTGGLFDGYFTCGFEDHNLFSFIDFNTIGCMPDDPTCCWPLYDAPGYSWPKEKLTCLMNGGIHIFNHLGHAGYKYDMKLYTSDLGSLTNTDYFFAYSQGCMPGGFDTTNCFAEVITTMEHGAFAVVMNARYGWGERNSTDGPSQRFDRQFWDAPLGEGILEIGRANQDSKEDNIWGLGGPCIRWCYYELNLFGDPQQQFKMDPSQRVHNVTQDWWFTHIQDAIDYSDEGDEIVVYPGTYYESLVLRGKNLVIRGVVPNNWDIVAATVIDGNGATDTVFSQQSAIQLSGLTITGGSNGIRCIEGGRSVINNCIIRGNDKGIVPDSTTSTIRNCIIRDNSGEGILGLWGHIEAKNNLIYNNNEGMRFQHGLSYSSCVRNNTIVNNSNCGIRFECAQNIPISNCILWNNGDELSGCTATYSCIKDCNDANDVNHNICSDPRFVDANFHIDFYSPCVNAGNPDVNLYAGEVDIDGQPRVQDWYVDIGADEVRRVHNITQNKWYVHIQHAIDALEYHSTDEIVVYPGTYYESLYIRVKNPVIHSIDPCNWDVVAATVIEGSGATDTVLFEQADGHLSGFTVTGGTRGVSFEEGSSPVVSNCIISNNLDKGVNVDTGSPTITNCIIRDNGNEGIFADYGNTRLNNNVIYNNDGGIRLRNIIVTVRNNTIVNNRSYGIKNEYSPSVSISNCIVWDNNDELSGCIATYSCIKDCNDANASNHNICSDPCFVDSNYFHLGFNSPCVDAGDPVGDYEGQTDIDGDPRVIRQRADIGADEVPTVHNVTQDTWHICIQDAIDYSDAGDEIVAYPGTYYESLYINKHVVLRCNDANDWDVVAATVIDGDGATNVVMFGSGSTLSGFTVTGGTNGIRAATVSGIPTINRCIIRDNTTTGVTTGVSGSKITNCIIKDNGSEGLSVGIPGCQIKSSIICGHNTGMKLTNSWPIITNCTIVDNNNGVIRNYNPYGPQPTISNCILWNYGDDLVNCIATYSCIKDCNDANASNHNICSDPCFLNADGNDFHIDIHSPCINAGYPSGNYNGQVDIDGESRVISSYVDIGADEVLAPDAHWWKLDETSGTIAYDSIDNNDANFNCYDPCWVDGLIGGAIDCNGVSDYFSVLTLDNAYGTYNTFTVAGWFKTIQSTGIQTIVGKWGQYSSGPTYYAGWQVLVENNKVVARFGGMAPGQIFNITGTSDVNDGQWHHFALVRQPSGSRVLYVDGQQEGTPLNCVFNGSNTKFRIGDGSYVSSGNPVKKGGPFCGKIDDVMIFNRALTADEVEELYESGQ